MTIAFLATGDEIVQGDTLDTNSHHLAHALNSEGLGVGLHLSCSDDEAEIYQCIEFLAKQHQVIILIGGLGPTSDDRTRYALSRYLKNPLKEFPEALTHIQNRLNQTNLSLNTGNKQQAMFPATAVLLPNPNGTAMGCYVEHDNKLFIMLPGPPRECLPMFNQHVLPILQKTKHHTNQLLKWPLFGVAESEIAEAIDEALQGINCKTGYRLDTPYVECKVWAEPQLVATITEILQPIIKPHLLTNSGKKASEELIELVQQRQKPIVILDEVTGGLLQSLIQRPETYSLIKFHELNRALLHFHVCGLYEYWSKQPNKGQTSLAIFYSHNRFEGKETHVLPHRSPLVVYYAAELISSRLLHLINQLH
ncbi:Competence damage inducible protein CinA [Legionella beliardensis]|uniref:Competence damage inducible protein CinA n=1 Tax=Legionella beliardensis TaxID=91822 RepID=A0A378HYU5_9GAMM|nr:competence/damage-inducible protein A [Legionella beliardensis]STX28077.1 Competence damage inducible protein CinA [Legionella beliardensis]